MNPRPFGVLCVSWLSSGQVLTRLFELHWRSDVLLGKQFSFLRLFVNSEWLSQMACQLDIYSHLNYLNFGLHELSIIVFDLTDKST